MASEQKFNEEKTEATEKTGASEVADGRKENYSESKRTFQTAETAAGGWRKISDRISEMKATVMETGRRAREFLIGKKEELKPEMEEMAERGGATAAEEEMKRRSKNEDPKSIRETAATRSITGAFSSVREAIRSKLTQPTDIVEETRAARERGGNQEEASAKVKNDYRFIFWVPHPT